jgi:hypothetical protein
MTMAVARGTVAGTYRTGTGSPHIADFMTTSVAGLVLDHSGIPGDLHAGALRRSGGRENWLPRGTQLRNDRQLSALSVVELAEIARGLDIPELEPEWIGGNLLIDGVDAFSRIAPGSRLAIGGSWGGKGRFDGGAILRVEAYNRPCRQSGRALAGALERPDLEFAFVKHAASLRGLVLSVDLAGPVAPGDAVVVMAPLVPQREG